jgi:nicotinamide-nucleotide amidase
MENLNVRQETLERFGAVSRETAVEMAAGVRRISRTDLGLAVTGIAGPDGGTDEKPVGLVYIALADKDGVDCKEFRLWGSRSRIRNVTSLHAFDMIRRKMISFEK